MTSSKTTTLVTYDRALPLSEDAGSNETFSFQYGVPSFVDIDGTNSGDPVNSAIAGTGLTGLAMFGNSTAGNRNRLSFPNYNKTNRVMSGSARLAFHGTTNSATGDLFIGFTSNAANAQAWDGTSNFFFGVKIAFPANAQTDAASVSVVHCNMGGATSTVVDEGAFTTLAPDAIVSPYSTVSVKYDGNGTLVASVDGVSTTVDIGKPAADVVMAFHINVDRGLGAGANADVVVLREVSLGNDPAL